MTKGHRQYTPLGQLLRRAAEQEALTAELRALLPGTLRPAVRVTGLKGDQLTLTCSSAAVATRVRFAVPDLLPSLRALAHFADVDTVRVTVG
ncbi:MAG: DciA family protein [Pseudomonadota bacterium]